MKIRLTELKQIIRNEISITKKKIIKENFDDFLRVMKDMKVTRKSQGSSKKFVPQSAVDKLLPDVANDEYTITNILKKTYDKIAHVYINHDFKIKKLLAAGTVGIIYLLEDGNILKLYTKDHSEGRDQEWYKNLHDAQYTGFGSKYQPHISHYGTAEAEGKKVHFVIMSKVTPFDSLIGNRDEELINRQCWDLSRLIGNKVGNKKLIVSSILNYNIDGDTKQYLNNELPSLSDKQKQIYLTTNGLTRIEVQRIYEMLISSIKTLPSNKETSKIDLHVGNFGLLGSSREDNPTFVLFDV